MIFMLANCYKHAMCHLSDKNALTFVKTINHVINLFLLPFITTKFNL
jgi:hypothetical protein